MRLCKAWRPCSGVRPGGWLTLPAICVPGNDFRAGFSRLRSTLWAGSPPRADAWAGLIQVTSWVFGFHSARTVRQRRAGLLQVRRVHSRFGKEAVEHNGGLHRGVEPLTDRREWGRSVAEQHCPAAMRFGARRALPDVIAVRSAKAVTHFSLVISRIGGHSFSRYRELGAMPATVR